MGCQDSFSKASMPTIIVFFIAFITNFCNWIAFTTTSWYVTDLPLDTSGDIHQGLWRECRDKLISGCVSLDGWADSTFAAVQAFAILGFISVNLGHIMITLYIFWNSVKKNSELGFFNGITFIMAGMFWMVTTVIFSLGHDEDDADLHYSFGFAICACILAAISGFITFYASKADQSTEPTGRRINA